MFSPTNVFHYNYGNYVMDELPWLHHVMIMISLIPIEHIKVAVKQ